MVLENAQNVVWESVMSVMVVAMSAPIVVKSCHRGLSSTFILVSVLDVKVGTEHKPSRMHMVCQTSSKLHRDKVYQTVTYGE